MRSIILFLCGMSFHFLCMADTPKLLNFYELPEFANTSLHADEVQIRGFLYVSKNDALVLAAEPNLRSCCVGKREMKNKQLIVSGDIKKDVIDGSAVLLQGRFVADRDGYRLENASVVEEKGFMKEGLLVLGLGICLLGIVFYCRIIRRG